MIDLPIVLFTLTSLVIIVTPGQDLVLVMTRSIAQGSKAGMMTASGVSFGLLGHTVLAALGLGALIQASYHLFFVLKIVGALYLVYLGWKTFVSKPVQLDSMNLDHKNTQKCFVQGALSNLVNPKIAIFYFAYLPQFVPQSSSNAFLDLLILGSWFAFLTFLIKVPVGYIAGKLSNWFRANPDVQIWLNRTSGTVLIGLGIKLAFDERPQ